MPEPHLRAADADRAAVASTLGEHMSAGRLTLEEFDDRVAQAYTAKTYGELAALTADLPAPGRGTHSSVPRTTPAPTRAHRRHSGSCAQGDWNRDPGQAWRSWVTTSLIVLTIWAATSLASWELNYFWPIWVIGPWGAVLLAQAMGRSGERRRSQDRQRPRIDA